VICALSVKGRKRHKMRSFPKNKLQNSIYKTTELSEFGSYEHNYELFAEK